MGRVVSVTHKGSFTKTEKFLNKVLKRDYLNRLDKFGKLGVQALSEATPVDTGLTAASWYYEIRETKGAVSIYWSNSNIENGFPVALLIYYGHGTKNGGYVKGRDYINPAIRPVFDKMADDAWKEVTS